MSKFINEVNADILRAEIQKKINTIVTDALDPDAGIEIVASAKYRKDALSDVLSLIEALQQPEELPTLRQAIEEYMYDQLVRKIPEFKAGRLELKLSLQESTVKKIKKDYEQNGIPATAVGKVCTNTDPKLLIVDSDEWQTVLGQFDNGQRVRIILVKEDEE